MPSTPGDAIDPALVALSRSLRRFDDRVRRWSATRWAARGSTGVERAALVHALAVTLADLARRAGNGAPDEAPPVIGAHAIPDQIAVLGAELLNAPDASAFAQPATKALERVLDQL